MIWVRIEKQFISKQLTPAKERYLHNNSLRKKYEEQHELLHVYASMQTTIKTAHSNLTLRSTHADDKQN